MTQEFKDKLKPHEDMLNLALNHGQAYDPSNRDAKFIVSVWKELNPNAPKFCETCWADTTLKIMDVATEYFKPIEPKEESKKK